LDLKVAALGPIIWYLPFAPGGGPSVGGWTGNGKTPAAAK
jgi:hypothetical protein